ncbi:MAG TPA: ABC transporter transmembrane domain-containing protein, partial [Pyrinomonadaceae bacterium]|nr:ABC transporter transmembrane domain-containing protein [Pyrinomonadaceae bacterium]
MSDLRKLVKYFRPYKASLILGIGCIVAGVIFNVTIPIIFGNVVDANWEQVKWSSLTIAALKVLGASAMSGLFLFLQRRIIIGMSRNIEYDLRQDFYAHLVDQPLSFFHEHRTGDLMARATNDL